MLRPAANLVYADAAQCICPRLALLTQARAQASRSVSGTRRVHAAPRRQSQAGWTRDQKTGFSNDLTETLGFLGTKAGTRETRIDKGNEDPRRKIQISSLRDDGTSYKIDSPQAPRNRTPRQRAPFVNFKPNSRNPNSGGPQTRGRNTHEPMGQERHEPATSAQMLQQMIPPEDDHKDAINGDIPDTSMGNPAFAKLMRRMRDLANHGEPAEVFAQAKDMAAKGYAPTLEAYSCMIQACAHPKNGARMQETAISLLAELKAEGFVPNSTIFHNLLKIFAHSPDYLSMEAVLKEMKTVYWIEPDTEGAQYILQHYLATGQIERALEMFDERRSKGEKIHYNTYMEIIKALGRVNEVEEAMRIMFEFQKEWGSLSAGLQPIAWYELLNIAASNYHIDGVSYIWRKVVQTPPANPGTSRNTLNPDDGLCLKVLNTAARHGNPKLALEVFRILTLRGVPFQEPHFAALIAAYARNGELTPAFRALTLMRNQNIQTTPTTANAIVEALTSTGSIANVDSAYATLKDFVNSSNKNEVVEITGFNAVLAACVKLGDLERALGVYTECTTLNVAPNTETFNILFAGCVECSSPPNKELAMFLANEMKEMGLRPDFVTYEELLKVSLYQQGDYEDAFVYLEEMKEVVEGGKVRPMVYEWIAARLHEKGDERFNMVVEEMKSLGYGDYVQQWEGASKTTAPTPTNI
ncbi:hypothetical protein H072_9820 [Dactylellina haptotyla CBS 200.50]|uniref:Pentatricopeptide repeat-containing protein-mitochondrial domain-containing protein n=1 Tax=Dactylellina haptotyla (strain CBS 200.50) TaxID=1284197 RepID=S8A0T3_DACHA|nr:hypothetical protein H072_9820 [Dactylellina haptotyla CBS 200.50]